MTEAEGPGVWSRHGFLSQHPRPVSRVKVIARRGGGGQGPIPSPPTDPTYLDVALENRLRLPS